MKSVVRKATLNAMHYFLGPKSFERYDSARAGDFSPLRYIEVSQEIWGNR
jgi:hypothetical protein